MKIKNFFASIATSVIGMASKILTLTGVRKYIPYLGVDADSEESALPNQTCPSQAEVKIIHNLDTNGMLISANRENFRKENYDFSRAIILNATTKNGQQIFRSSASNEGSVTELLDTEGGYKYTITRGENDPEDKIYVIKIPLLVDSKHEGYEELLFNREGVCLAYERQGSGKSQLNERWLEGQLTSPELQQSYNQQQQGASMSGASASFGATLGQNLAKRSGAKSPNEIVIALNKAREKLNQGGPIQTIYKARKLALEEKYNQAIAKAVIAPLTLAELKDGTLLTEEALRAKIDGFKYFQGADIAEQLANKISILNEQKFSKNGEYVAPSQVGAGTERAVKTTFVAEAENRAGDVAKILSEGFLQAAGLAANPVALRLLAERAKPENGEASEKLKEAMTEGLNLLLLNQTTALTLVRENGIDEIDDYLAKLKAEVTLFTDKQIEITRTQKALTELGALLSEKELKDLGTYKINTLNNSLVHLINNISTLIEPELKALEKACKADYSSTYIQTVKAQQDLLEAKQKDLTSIKEQLISCGAILDQEQLTTIELPIKAKINSSMAMFIEHAPDIWKARHDDITQKNALYLDACEKFNQANAIVTQIVSLQRGTADLEETIKQGERKQLLLQEDAALLKLVSEYKAQIKSITTGVDVDTDKQQISSNYSLTTESLDLFSKTKIAEYEKLSHVALNLKVTRNKDESKTNAESLRTNAEAREQKLASTEQELTQLAPKLPRLDEDTKSKSTDPHVRAARDLEIQMSILMQAPTQERNSTEEALARSIDQLIDDQKACKRMVTAFVNLGGNSEQPHIETLTHNQLSKSLTDSLNIIKFTRSNYLSRPKEALAAADMAMVMMPPKKIIKIVKKSPALHCKFVFSTIKNDKQISTWREAIQAIQTLPISLENQLRIGHLEQDIGATIIEASAKEIFRLKSIQKKLKMEKVNAPYFDLYIKEYEANVKAIAIQENGFNERKMQPEWNKCMKALEVNQPNITLEDAQRDALVALVTASPTNIPDEYLQMRNTTTTDVIDTEVALKTAKALIEQQKKTAEAIAPQNGRQGAGGAKAKNQSARDNSTLSGLFGVKLAASQPVANQLSDEKYTQEMKRLEEEIANSLGSELENRKAQLDLVNQMLAPIKKEKMSLRRQSEYTNADAIKELDKSGDIFRNKLDEIEKRIKILEELAKIDVSQVGTHLNDVSLGGNQRPAKANTNDTSTLNKNKCV